MKKKEEIIVAAVKKAPEQVQPYLMKAAPAMALIGTVLEMAYPYWLKVYALGEQVYAFLEPYHPEDMACVGAGLFMAFFGGEYPALITAVEAYRQIGFEPTLKALRALWRDLKTVQEAMEKDDKVDADNDGVPDVQQISADQVVERKLLLMLRTTDPETVTEAITAISSGWLAVLASLKISFARAITLGAAIGDVLRKPAVRYLGPLAKKLVPEDYQRWIVPVITYTCKTIAISIAWTIQKVISAFHSAIRGGHLAANGLVKYMNKYGLISITPDDTLADEIVGYIIAALGFLMQLYTGFRVPFPLNLLFLPFSIIETIIVWTIMD